MSLLGPVLAPLSLRLKLTLGYALIFGVTALIFTLGVLLIARRELQASLDASLRAAAQAASVTVVRRGAHLQFSPSARPARDALTELFDTRGQLQDTLGSREEGFRLTFDPRPGFSDRAEWRVLVWPVPGGSLRVSRASDILSELLETLGRVMLLSALVLVLVACLAGYVLADRALRPVDVVARTARRIARQGVYQERVPLAPGHDEMARLTSTVNEMLESLEGTIEREKAFARTAAHELRTPLTALKGRLELALERPREAADYRRSLNSMLQRVEDLIALSEALLVLARTETRVQLEAVELGALALEAADQLGPDVPLHLDVEQSWVQAEPAGVRQVIINLLDNAHKYAPAGQLSLVVRGGEVSVQDLGPGPLEADWPRLVRPFERGVGHQAVSGNGLGLALVAALASRWNAQVIPEWGGGSFTVRVRWPAGSVQDPDAPIAALPGRASVTS